MSGEWGLWVVSLQLVVKPDMIQGVGNRLDEANTPCLPKITSLAVWHPWMPFFLHLNFQTIRTARTSCSHYCNKTIIPQANENPFNFPRPVETQNASSCSNPPQVLVFPSVVPSQSCVVKLQSMDKIINKPCVNQEGKGRERIIWHSLERSMLATVVFISATDHEALYSICSLYLPYSTTILCSPCCQPAPQQVRVHYARGNPNFQSWKAWILRGSMLYCAHGLHWLLLSEMAGHGVTQ